MAKNVFITGGSRGIGAASVKKFFEEGWNVAFTDVNEAAAMELLKKLNSPDRICFRKADVKNYSTDKASFCTGGHYLCDGGLVAK